MKLEVVSNVPQPGTPLLVKFSDLERFKEQPRKHFDPASIGELADSIMQDGLQVPIIVCMDPKRKGVYIIVDGERRYRAFEIIYERTGQEPVIPVIVRPVKDRRQHFRMSAIANLHREDMTDLDEAAALYQLNQDGESIANLAILRGKSVTYVQNYMKMHGLPDEVKVLMNPRLPKDKRLNTTSAIDVAQSSNDRNLRIELAKEIVARNMGVNDARMLIGEKGQSRGFGFGGQNRHPADDYKVLCTFLARLARDSDKFSKASVNKLYKSRSNEPADRAYDVAILKTAIANLKKLQQDIGG